MAEAVTRMPETEKQHTGFLKKKPLEVQTRPNQTHQSVDTGHRDESAKRKAPPIIREVLGSPGRPLDSASKAYFEPRFREDFRRVRIHTGPTAAKSAHALRAEAYTVGQNVVFARGRYAPQTRQGRRLLAHELTHVVQQRNGQGPSLQREIKSVTNASGDGWLTVKHSDGDTYPPLPQYLKVDHTNTSGGREHFIIKESGRNGSFIGKKASVKKKNDGSYLTTGASYTGSAQVSFDKTKKELKYGSQGPVDAKTQSSNPIPDGTYDLEIPYEEHSLGSDYQDSAKYATTWFRVGHSGDRFLHPGRISAGCATVTSLGDWDSIYSYLINSRKGDNKSVGKIKVTS